MQEGKNMTRNTRVLGAGFVTAILAAAVLILPAHAAKAQSANTSSTGNQAQSQDTSQGTSTPALKPNLAGTWNLNEKQSDDPREKMREAMNANGDQDDSGATNPGRTGRRPGRGPTGRGGMMRQFSQLAITQTGKGVNVTGATGRLIATSEPQSNSDQSAQDNPNAQDNGGGRMMRMPPAAAKWQGNQLVATSNGFGGTITRTFELSPDGKQLYMTTKIENERFSQPVTYRFVYDPAKSDNKSQ
jgi:hypothetical protein